MQKVRVLFITPGPLLGGGATVSLYRLIRYMDRQRYEPIVLCHEGSSTNPYAVKLHESGVRVLTLSNDKAGLSPGPKITSKASARHVWVERLSAWKQRHPSVQAAYNVWRTCHHLAAVDWRRCMAIAYILKQQQINLVHLNHAVCKHRGDIMAARLIGVPCVGHVRVFDRFETIDGPLLRSVDYFAYMSHALQTHVQAWWPAAKGSVVYDGLDMADYSRLYDVAQMRAEMGLSSDDFVVGNVGRLVGWKGQDIFIRALAAISRQTPNLKALIVGRPDPGQESYLEELKALTIACGLERQVVFTGFCLEVPRLLSAMDVVVHSSSDPEPFGLVVIEGMAAGKPVVATRAGGPLESISDGVDGLLVPPGDSEAMARAILSLYQDRERATDIGVRAREKALKQFAVQRFVTQMQEIFESLLEARR